MHETDACLEGLAYISLLYIKHGVYEINEKLGEW